MRFNYNSCEGSESRVIGEGRKNGGGLREADLIEEGFPTQARLTHLLP